MPAPAIPEDDDERYLLRRGDDADAAMTEEFRCPRTTDCAAIPMPSRPRSRRRECCNG